MYMTFILMPSTWQWQVMSFMLCLACSSSAIWVVVSVGSVIKLTLECKGSHHLSSCALPLSGNHSNILACELSSKDFLACLDLAVGYGMASAVVWEAAQLEAILGVPQANGYV